MDLQLGYLGPKGSFSYEAAMAYAPKAYYKEFKTFYDIIYEVEEGLIDEGILPIENSTEGAVTPVMDALLKTKNSHIKEEIVIDIVHNILSIGKSIENIKYIYSHAQVIGQCREFFQNNYPHIILLPCESSSAACLIAKEKGESYGAIGNRYVANLYGLNILSNSIQDNSLNQTRFIIISRQISEKSKKDKTSIAFSFHGDMPGSLHSVLKEFTEKHLNLTRIESRPAKAEVGKYIFYIDFYGHIDDSNVQSAIKSIQSMTRFFKVFGSYKAFE